MAEGPTDDRTSVLAMGADLAARLCAPELDVLLNGPGDDKRAVVLALQELIWLDALRLTTVRPPTASDRRMQALLGNRWAGGRYLLTDGNRARPLRRPLQAVYHLYSRLQAEAIKRADTRGQKFEDEPIGVTVWQLAYKVFSEYRSRLWFRPGFVGSEVMVPLHALDFYERRARAGLLPNRMAWKLTAEGGRARDALQEWAVMEPARFRALAPSDDFATDAITPQVESAWADILD